MTLLSSRTNPQHGRRTTTTNALVIWYLVLCNFHADTYTHILQYNQVSMDRKSLKEIQLHTEFLLLVIQCPLHLTYLK